MNRKPLQLPNIVFSSEIGAIKAPGGDVKITDISAYLSRVGDIIIEGFIDARHPKDIKDCDIVFQAKSGWKITGKNFTIFNEQVTVNAGYAQEKILAAFKAIGTKLIGERGKIASADKVNIYELVTDLDFAGDVHIAGLNEFAVKFNEEKLKDLMLIKSNFPEVPRSVGYFEVSDTYENYRNKWFGIFDHLLLLFKFAASHIVNFPVIYITNLHGDELIEIDPYIKEIERGGNIFYLNYPGELSRLVDSTFTSFVSLRDKLGLDKLVLDYVMMKNIRFTEIGYLMGCVFMAGLTYNFAKNIKKYPANGSTNLKSDMNSYNLKELVEELYDNFNIVNADTDFIKYRDEIINQGGISSIQFPDIVLEKEKLDITIEHLLLNILHYDGLYWDRPSREWVEYRDIYGVGHKDAML